MKQSDQAPLGVDVGPAPQTGRHVRLRAVVPPDYQFLYELAMSEELGWRWRSRGTSMSPEGFAQAMWQDSLAQFMIVHPESGEPFGLVTAYGANFKHGWTYYAQVMRPDLMGTAIGMEAAALFVNYLFTNWNLRKIYIEAVEFNFDQFRSGLGKYFDQEGCRRAHEFYQGRYWDSYTLAIHRERWEAEWKRLLRIVLPREPGFEWVAPAGWPGSGNGNGARHP
ncbi:MAG: GNAT family N-acetyltransferase [Myxococcales bacterium]|nr:GNAT family N-acetyltransferase [Myxococcales bacterium]